MENTTAVATETPDPREDWFQADDKAIFHMVGNVPVVWLSQEDHQRYLEWRDARKR